MNKIKEIFYRKEKTYSFELFPPKTEKGYTNLLKTIEQLCALKPDFISCTYGAGGGNRDKTLDIVHHIEKQHQVTGLAHLTCVLHTKEEIRQVIYDMQSRGIKNILALRGDPPIDQPNWKAGEENFKYSSELCAFIEQNFKNRFCVGVAGFPEGHILCQDRDLDARYLKVKTQFGGDFVITQLFFDNNDYFQYVNRLRKLDVDVPIVPGILPITNYERLLKFTSMCGARVTQEVKEIFEPIKNDPEATLSAGIDFAVKQGRDLLNNRAPGLHFYCLNKCHPTTEILNQIRN